MTVSPGLEPSPLPTPTPRSSQGGRETPEAILDKSWAWLKKLGKILTFFAESDPVVKERVAVENVTLGVLNPLISLSLNNQLTTKTSFTRFSDLIVVILKCVRALAVEPKTLKKLDRELAIVTLMPLLSLEQMNPAYDNSIGDETIINLFYLCRIGERLYREVISIMATR